jgi:hypothetical protein
LYNIFTEFGVTIKLARLIKMNFNEAYSKVLIGINVLDAFPIQNYMKEGDDLSSFLFIFALDFVIRKFQKK